MKRCSTISSIEWGSLRKSSIASWRRGITAANSSSNDTNVYAMLSYLEIPNTHVLEQAIRMAFKNGGVRLSDVLEDE